MFKVILNIQLCVCMCSRARAQGLLTELPRVCKNNIITASTHTWNSIVIKIWGR